MTPSLVPRAFSPCRLDLVGNWREWPRGIQPIARRSCWLWIHIQLLAISPSVWIPYQPGASWTDSDGWRVYEWLLYEMWMGVAAEWKVCIEKLGFLRKTEESDSLTSTLRGLWRTCRGADVDSLINRPLIKRGGSWLRWFSLRWSTIASMELPSLFVNP